MLGLDTLIRTPHGDRTLASLGARAVLYDAHNRLIEVDIGPPEAITDPFTVSFWPYSYGNANARRADDVSFTRYVADGKHPLFLVAAQASSPGLAQAGNDRGRGAPYRVVTWITRCVESVPPELQAWNELRHPSDAQSERGNQTSQVSASSSSPYPSPPTSPSPILDRPPERLPSRPHRHASTQAHTMIRLDLNNSSDVEEPPASSDASFAVGLEADAAQGDSDASDGSSDDEEQPLSSEAWQEAEAYSAQLIRWLRARLQGGCDCHGVRQIMLTCGSQHQAEHFRHALRHPHLASLVDPEALIVGEPHVVSACEYFNSRHLRNPGSTHLDNAGTGDVPRLAYVKMPRWPFEVLPPGGTPMAELPIDPWWLGAWLGDGTHNQALISCGDHDLEVTRARLQAYVDDLNSSRPLWAAPLHLHASSHLNTTGLIGRPVWSLSITSTVNGATAEWWNPILTAMQELDIFNNHKVNGVPALYRNADADAKAALLAGLMDSDGSAASNSTAYKIRQGERHRTIMEHAHQLAVDLGINARPLRDCQWSHPTVRGRTLQGVEFIMFGKALEKLQPHIIHARKRLRIPGRDVDQRAIVVNRVEAAGPQMGRHIRLPGHQSTTIQLSQGFVVYADSPPMTTDENVPPSEAESPGRESDHGQESGRHPQSENIPVSERESEQDDSEHETERHQASNNVAPPKSEEKEPAHEHKFEDPNESDNVASSEEAIEETDSEQASRGHSENTDEHSTDSIYEHQSDETYEYASETDTDVNFESETETEMEV